MQQLGPYQLECELGRGGMGVVYRARDVRNGRIVALKVLLDPAGDLELFERFRREVTLLRGVEHPNLVRVLDVNLQPPRPCAVFEYVAGGTLHARVQREGPLPWRTAVRIVAEVAAGVAAVHERGLLHRDIKPENVLLAPGEAKLGDFGLVKDLRDESLTLSGSSIGTPGFMAPEQVGSEKDRWGETTDVYGLAATLYFALTGMAPFTGPSALSVLSRVVGDPPEPPLSHSPGVPAWLNAAVLRGLSKQGGDRFPSALALRATLLTGGVGQQSRRAWAALLGVAAGALALAGGVAWATWGAAEATPGMPLAPRAGELGASSGGESEAGRILIRAGQKHEAGNHAEALEDFDAYCALRPEDSRGHVGRAETLGELSRYTEAAHAYQRAEALTDDAQVVESIAAVLRTYRERSRSELAAGKDALSQGDHHAARVCFDRAVDLGHGRVEEAYAERGVFFLDQGDREAAAVDFANALELAPSAELHYELGSIQRNADALPEARANFAAAIELKSDMVLAHRGLGQVLVQLGSYDEALVAFTRQTELEPQGALGHALRADVLVQLDRLPEAEEAYTRARELKPGSAQIALRHGTLLHLLERYAEAVVAYDLALLGEQPAGSQVQRQRDMAAAEQPLRGAPPGLEANTSKALVDLQDEAKRFFVQGEFEKAVRSLTLALELNPNNAALLFNRGNAKVRLGDHEGALQDFSSCLERRPNDAGVARARGQALAALGRGWDARHEFERGLSLATDARVRQDFETQVRQVREYLQSIRDRAHRAARENRIEAALEFADQAVEFSQGHVAETYFDRATYRQVLRDPVGALEDARAAVRIDPIPKHYCLAGSFEVARSRWVEAEALFLRALELDPEFVRAHAGLGRVRNGEGRHEEALLEFRRAIELDPQDPFAYVIQGRVLSSLGRHAEAVRSVRRATELKPRQVAYRHLLAKTLHLAGRYAEAVVEYDTTLRSPLAPAPAAIRSERDLAAAGQPLAD